MTIKVSRDVYDRLMYDTDSAFYEDARQEALTFSLGQVQCADMNHGGDLRCTCGAAL